MCKRKLVLFSFYLPLLLLLLFFFFLVASFGLAGCVSMAPFEKAVATVINEKIGPGQDARYDVSCDGFGCSALFDALPPLENVSCEFQFVFGACCLATFEGGSDLEIHLWRRGGKYKIPFEKRRTAGLCLNPRFNPNVSPDRPAGQKFAPCPEFLMEVWRTEAPSVNDR
jgi:hypothetical protein